MRFIADNPDVPVVQMDSVIGNKSGKVLLTMFSQNTNLLLAFLRDHNTARSVLDVFNDLYAMFGRETYCRLFPVILTDRGSEFSNPVPIEQDENGELRSLVFYCNPSAPYQKGGIEVAHELVRRVLPKGKSFDDLQQGCRQDLDLLTKAKKLLKPTVVPAVFLLLSTGPLFYLIQKLPVRNVTDHLQR